MVPFGGAKDVISCYPGKIILILDGIWLKMKRGDSFDI
jgi:hypothetical protein